MRQFFQHCEYHHDNCKHQQTFFGSTSRDVVNLCVKLDAVVQSIIKLI